MSDTIIWITGASEGIGASLAENCPHKGARIISLSRRKHPVLETVQIDLTDPASWDRVRAHVTAELAAFKGRRALFIQSAYSSDAHGPLRGTDAAVHQKAVLANVAAPLVMGEIFLRACKPDYEAGLVMMSAGAAVWCLPGLSAYGPGKIAIEHWAQIMDSEMRDLPAPRPWVVAIRAGGVATGPVLRTAAKAGNMAQARHIQDNLKNRLTPDAAAKHIWAALPPPPGISVISFGDEPTDPEYQFDHARLRRVQVPGWKLVYR